MAVFHKSRYLALQDKVGVSGLIFFETPYYPLVSHEGFFCGHFVLLKCNERSTCGSDRQDYKEMYHIKSSISKYQSKNSKYQNNLISMD